PVRAAGQEAGSITGSVVAESGQPLAGVRVVAQPSERAAITDALGSFSISPVPPGPVRVSAARIGYEEVSRDVTVEAGATTRLDLVLPESALSLGAVVVSVSREAQRLSETPATVDVVSGERIRETGAAHPSEIMRQVAGAWVNVTSGEGHQTAIRQPL